MLNALSLQWPCDIITQKHPPIQPPSWLLKMAYVTLKGPSINQKQLDAKWTDLPLVPQAIQT